MRELNLDDIGNISGAAVPAMAAGAVIGAAGYLGSVAAGQEFSLLELGTYTLGGAIAPLAGGVAALTRITYATVAHASNIAFAVGATAAGASGQAGTDYNDKAGTNYGF